MYEHLYLLSYTAREIFLLISVSESGIWHGKVDRSIGEGSCPQFAKKCYERMASGAANCIRINRFSYRGMICGFV